MKFIFRNSIVYDDLEKVFDIMEGVLRYVNDVMYLCCIRGFFGNFVE